MTVNLIDAATHKTLANTTTGFDGYYTFEFVRPGSYILRADLSHEVQTLANTTTVTPDELFIYGNDVYIRIPGKEEPYGPPTRNEHAALMQAQKAALDTLIDGFSPAVNPADVSDIQTIDNTYGPPAPAEPPQLQE